MCFRETFFTGLQREDIYDLLRVSFPVQIIPLFLILASTVGRSRRVGRDRGSDVYHHMIDQRR